MLLRHAEEGKRPARRLLPALLAGAIALVLGLGASAASAAGRHATSGSKAQRKLPVLVDLGLLRTHGAIEQAALTSYRSTYLGALHALRGLTGTRQRELASVLANVNEAASSKALGAALAPSLFLTLQRNLQWWAGGGAELTPRQHVSFPGSRLVWEYYPGQGIEIEWLATFGEANGYYLSGQDEALREVLDEALALATNRAGGIAWDYLFHFDGGSPPWTSGLSQGTAIQALARAGARLHEPAFTEAAGKALGIFEHPPPAGVRAPTPGPGGEGVDGVEYLEYTYAPNDHILNGFIQALVGLYEYAQLTGSQLGQRLFEEGDAVARAEVPHYDTGAWSMYDQSYESPLNYHELLTEFLQHLCERTQHGLPLQVPATGGQGTPSSSPPAPSSGSTAGGAAPEQAAIPGDQVYCSEAERFASYLHTPPSITLLTHEVKPGFRAGVMFSLSKVSTISLTIRQGQKVVWTSAATVESGKPRLLWVTPDHGGIFTVEARVTDLAGNEATTSGTIRVLKPRRRHPSSRHRHAHHHHTPSRRG